MTRFFKLVVEIVLSPLTLIAALWLRFIRRRILMFHKKNSVVTERILKFVGVFPIMDHYYEPLFNASHLRHSLREDRFLPGIEWNTEGQLAQLKQFHYNDEILALSQQPASPLTYSFKSGSFGSGDAEFLYNMVRAYAPRRVIEVGCGDSTRLIQHAIARNAKEHPGYHCNHVCIEPYPDPWLKELSVQVHTDFVERSDPALFSALQSNDILFIDSSHMIRPQGDVLFEYLNILPKLNNGVLVHVHDIFTPKDYLDEWMYDGKVFWNEQYLLEAFLSFNDRFSIVGGLNYLKHHHYQALKSCCPMVTEAREPGSFWMKRIG